MPLAFLSTTSKSSPTNYHLSAGRRRPSASRINSLQAVTGGGPPSVDGGRTAAPGSVRGVGSMAGQSTVDDSFGGPFAQKPAKRYTTSIPSFLENSRTCRRRYAQELRRAAAPPPTLPMILSKVILNSSTSNRDDSSVLGIPNHVVLNHLATSSIKHQVLAISATTRYKRKVSCPITSFLPLKLRAEELHPNPPYDIFLLVCHYNIVQIDKRVVLAEVYSCQNVIKR